MYAKRCFKCEEVKPIEEFYRHPQMGDGHLGKCKECTKRDVKQRYQLVIEDRHAYEKNRNQEPERRSAMGDYRRQGRLRHPDRYKARTSVNNAVRDKKLVKDACCRCGSTNRVEAHHSDYSKPLDIDWVCFKCHREREHGQIVTFGGRYPAPDAALRFIKAMFTVVHFD